LFSRVESSARLRMFCFASWDLRSDHANQWHLADFVLFIDPSCVWGSVVSLFRSSS
jgi:hypothetical protein